MPDWIRGCDADFGNSLVTGGTFPDDVTATITFLFGPRAPLETSPGVWTGWVDPATGQRVDFHYGLDLAVTEGTPLLALGYGIVTNVILNDRSFGNAVECAYDGDDGHRYRAMYLHMRDASLVAIGDRVTPGQTVGYVGTTGASTGPHLHMQVWRDDYTIDPLSLLVAANPVGFVPPSSFAPPPPVVYPVPDVQWVAQGWGAEGASPWEHRYPLRAKTVKPGALINLVRDGRDADGWELFHLEVEDYEGV
jgi:murein DD-endopeptidase MepM/ murein hydrolase activator NlpD